MGGGRQVLENSSWRPGGYGNSGFQDISMCLCLFLLHLQRQNQRQYMERFKTAASEHKPLVQTLSNMKLTVQMWLPHTRHWLMGSRREMCGLRSTTDYCEVVMPLPSPVGRGPTLSFRLSFAIISSLGLHFNLLYFI